MPLLKLQVEVRELLVLAAVTLVCLHPMQLMSHQRFAVAPNTCWLLLLNASYDAVVLYFKTTLVLPCCTSLQVLLVLRPKLLRRP